MLHYAKSMKDYVWWRFDSYVVEQWIAYMTDGGSNIDYIGKLQTA